MSLHYLDTQTTTLCPDKKRATLFSTINFLISWSIFTLFASMKTEMNTPESHAITDLIA